MQTYQAISSLQKGHYSLVEGRVTDFKPMPYEGHQDECFSVQGERFCYSDYVITPGFHNAASHGGPIRAGLPVRIAYSGNTILRLDIEKDDLPNASQTASTKTSAEHAWQTTANNDPVNRRMTIAFLFTSICWTLWWNLQWKRAMRFWVPPPNRPWVQNAFRIFFAVSFVGAVAQFISQMSAHPLAKVDIKQTVGIAVVMCVVVATMSAFTLWMAKRKDAKTQ